MLVFRKFLLSYYVDKHSEKSRIPEHITQRAISCPVKMVFYCLVYIIQICSILCKGAVKQ